MTNADLVRNGDWVVELRPLPSLPRLCVSTNLLLRAPDCRNCTVSKQRAVRCLSSSITIRIEAWDDGNNLKTHSHNCQANREGF